MPPGTDAAGQRVLYESMEDRCNACEIYGGTMHPCCDTAPYQARGLLCPRVMLEPDNVIPFGIMAKANIEPAGLFNAWLPLYLQGLGLNGGQALVMIERAMATLAHPLILDYQEQERERARAAASSR